MDFSSLGFLKEPAFVLPWYGFGVLAALWNVYDTLFVNTAVNRPLKAAWPIIMIFFSVIGLIAYLWTCRPAGIGGEQGEAERRDHHEFVATRPKKVMGSLIHCVGGDGLGIMTAMVVSRIIGLEFWPEFWLEYAVGFAFGWFIFQYWAMREMGQSPLMALWTGGRAEFFSMVTVMVGMGLVMKFVTPAVVGHPPKPDTAAFWGFGAFGLLVGAVLTYPMNSWLVRIGWKHGMS